MSVTQLVRRRFGIEGVVQGVGFRPFVYRIATELGVSGFVVNTSSGVFVEAEGERACLERFVDTLRSELPALARIDRISTVECEPSGAAGFAICESITEAGQFALVPPDVGTCPECFADFTTAGNRRLGYAFTNCTNCGPRYSIIHDVPYDRPRTTMREFQMCPQCLGEYRDPLDRRFHAEPNACPECGPGLALLSMPELASGPPPDFTAGKGAPEILARTRRLLERGNIVAIKGLGGFHLACDAMNAAAVKLLRERKRRSGKAFAVMARDLAIAERLCEITNADRALLTSSRRPIVLLPRREASSVASAVAPGNSRLGVMLPYTPLHHLLFEDSTLEALVMTSGNISEEPIVSNNDEAWRLGKLADHFLLHNRTIRARVDDSVIATFENREYPVRRSRGYAPEPIDLGAPVTEVLACGGELKNTFCLTKGHYAILSQHIGDLENLETMGFFRETLEHLRAFFRVDPRAVACDLHPGYMSTRFALEESGLPTIGVQHHHAHIASCMADNRIEGKVIGVALDGTGYGTDGRIWGGEFLVCDFDNFSRRGHLAYMPLAGGDAAVRQPWRSGLAWLRATIGGAADRLPLPIFAEIPAVNRRVIEGMIARGINTVETSSCGRLFDAVSSILGIRQETTYEGQAAIELEMAATVANEPYAFAILDGDPFRVDLKPAIETIVRDSIDGVPRGVVSARFHLTVAEAAIECCEKIRVSDRLTRVCLSGGTFQNLRLLRHTVDGLRRRGFEVFIHRRVPANDGGLSLGQAVIASHGVIPPSFS